MKSKVMGIPLVLILLVLFIILPVMAWTWWLHASVMAELKKVKPVTVVTTVEEKVSPSPVVSISPTKKAPVATGSGKLK